MKRRLKRLVKAFVPRLARPDDAWALSRLSRAEARLFLAMDVRDRDHAVKVAQKLLERYPQAPDYAVRAALLHDFGKALRPYRAMERILTGLYAPKVAVRPLRGGIYGAWQVRRHHPLYAAERIEDPQVAQIVKEHHRPQSLWAQRLHEVDEEY
ncbi:MAG: HD domain-containing protein [Meiothermus silvanus]|uniref:HD domain-containing protein n=1 Tax=Allomeiothermus silvanus (strain ATCC 700542 / DSM 9946 / NBRC 106475 / NCIMB 13440 / VI-R2) TaxID=526227 RepID=D7BEA0_ALLS1|nr:HD domain-containing protein [Allomeiothermus silvanus]ADH64958.1 conserved hypothetical protein [Allomeiothermus silvanus DSM 9946]MBI5813943.1 HD domain-containing protein [Allomeiothermus silvanus]MCL6569813.1 HD domain-containing protein [Allomeiothermus silvanus]